MNLVVPFTVIPLTKFLSSELKMGQFRLSTRLRIACWIASFAAIILNLLTMCQVQSSSRPLSHPPSSKHRSWVVCFLSVAPLFLFPRRIASRLPNSFSRLLPGVSPSPLPHGLRPADLCPIRHCLRFVHSATAGVLPSSRLLIPCQLASC